MIQFITAEYVVLFGQCMTSAFIVNCFNNQTGRIKSVSHMVFCNCRKLSNFNRLNIEQSVCSILQLFSRLCQIFRSESVTFKSKLCGFKSSTEGIPVLLRRNAFCLILILLYQSCKAVMGFSVYQALFSCQEICHGLINFRLGSRILLQDFICVVPCIFKNFPGLFRVII